MQNEKLKPRIRKGILSNESNFKDRCFLNYHEIEPIVGYCRGLGMRLVLTSGTFDMTHIGHARYLETAKKKGDFLIVGVDSDKKVRLRKGSDRPVIPQDERMEILAHLRHVDAVVLKNIDAPKWGLIKLVRPDVLIATKETYTKDELKELKKYCKQVFVLTPQATTSASAKIRMMQIKMAQKFEKVLTPKLMKSIEEALFEISK